MSKLKTAPRESPAERTAAVVAEELDAMRAELAEAQRAFEALREQRRAALLTGTVEEVASFDGKFARGDARVDIATARIAVLAAELESLQIADDGEQREANYAKANSLAAEAEKLIRTVYSHHAAGIAAVLARLGEIAREVGKLNEHLPPGVARIDIEEFRGYARPLSDTVKLPSVTCDEPDFWPLRQRFERVSINEIYGSR